MTNRRPRVVLAAAALLLVAVLAAFAIALIGSQDAERENARERFVERADITAAVTESLFGASTQTSGDELEQLFGGPTVDAKVLAERAAQSQTPLLFIVGTDGQVLGTTGDRELSQQLADEDVVERVLADQAYGLSDFVEGAAPDGGDGLIYALAFDGTDGRRAYVQTFGTQLLQVFLGGFLGGIPGADTTNSYIVDSKGLVIASPVKDQGAGVAVEEEGLVSALEMERDGEYSTGGDDRTYASAMLENSTWRVVLTQRSSVLYAGISSTVEWLILVALGIAGLFALGALWRTTQAAVAVQTANDRLEEANAELARSNLELQRSNSELEQFASVASHDLQEPLRKVQTFGDQLERRFGEDIPDEGLDYLRRMRKAAGRMSVLIDDLLRFSRVTTRALPPEPVDLARVAREVVSDLEAAIAETHADVRIGRMPTVDADPLQMRQLLQNLIINGVKFHRPGIPPELAIEEAHAPPGFVAFEVRDNGIGIEPEYQDRIFRVFERLHPRDVYEGTGIGLALCRKIAERHGGTVEVESVPGEGATFRVSFPVHAGVGPHREARAEPADMRPRSPAGV